MSSNDDVLTRRVHDLLVHVYNALVDWDAHVSNAQVHMQQTMNLCLQLADVAATKAQEVDFDADEAQADTDKRIHELYAQMDTMDSVCIKRIETKEEQLYACAGIIQLTTTTTLPKLITDIDCVLQCMQQQMQCNRVVCADMTTQPSDRQFLMCLIATFTHQPYLNANQFTCLKLNIQQIVDSIS